MSLYKTELKYLRRLLTKAEDKFWARDSLLEKIKDEEKRLQDIKSCDHEFYKLEEIKTCCIHCGAYAKGMGFERTTKEKVNKKIMADDIEIKPPLFRDD